MNIWDVDCGYKGLVFSRNNGSAMEPMDKGLTVLKWALIFWPKKLQNLSALLCPSAQAKKFWMSMKQCFIGRP